MSRGPAAEARPRRILITGCSSGVGQAAAIRIARHGDHVFATVRSTADGEALARAAVGSAGTLTVLQMEITSEPSVRAAVAAAQVSGDLEVVINNAGVPCVGSIEELPLDAWREVMEINLLGAVRVCQAVIPTMRARRHGRIINITSSIAVAALPLYGAYCASKFALEAVSEAMHHELAPFGIAVQVLRPGIITTSFVGKKQLQSGPRLPPDSPYAGRLDNPSPVGLMHHVSSAEDVAAALERMVNGQSTVFRTIVGEDSQRWCAARAQLNDAEFFARLAQHGYSF